MGGRLFKTGLMRAKRGVILLAFIIVVCLVKFFPFIQDILNTGYKGRLYAPTMLYKTEKYYYITDCLHGRVIYCDSLDPDLLHWKTLYDNVKGVHSIASDGRFVIFDDTEGSRLLVYEEKQNGLEAKGELNTPRSRPHYIQFDPFTNRFYALCSRSGILLTLKSQKETVVIERMDSIPYLANHYVRSFNIIDRNMFFVSGRDQRPPMIYQVDYKNNFSVVDSFLVPNEISNANHIAKNGNYFYVTSLSDSTANRLSPAITKVHNLKDLGGVKIFTMSLISKEVHHTT